jgi:hypothetical protein
MFSANAGILIESSVSAGALENVSSVLQSITVGTSSPRPVITTLGANDHLRALLPLHAGTFLYVGVLGTVVEEFSTHKGIVPKACLFFFGTWPARSYHHHLSAWPNRPSVTPACCSLFCAGLLAMGLLSMLDPPPSAPA